METLPATQFSGGGLTPLSIDNIRNQVQLIQHLMKDVMKEGEHYGTIPGCGDKPALKKPGAEKLCMVFRLIPSFDVKQIDFERGHREIQIKATLKTLDGTVVGEGVGSCSTLETKYRWRTQSRKCPKCQAEAIIKGRDEYGGGWLCHRKQGGCGNKFQDGDPAIEDQVTGRVENADIADVYNTVLKMAKKRAHVDVTITACAASDIFIQDLDEDWEDIESEQRPKSTPLPFAYRLPKSKTGHDMKQIKEALSKIGCVYSQDKGLWLCPKKLNSTHFPFDQYLYVEGKEPQVVPDEPPAPEEDDNINM